MRKKVARLPGTDLPKLNTEVLARGSLAGLPRNLPDHWLRIIARDLAQSHKAALHGDYERSEADLAAPILLLTSLLAHKQKLNATEISLSAIGFLDGVRKFEAAVMMEIIGRETGVFIRRYSVDDIV